MDTERIIRTQSLRAEAMVSNYLGFYAADLELADLNVMAIKDVSHDFKRCVQLIQGLLDAKPTVQVARNMVTLVDALADLVRVPRMRKPLMRLWEIESNLSSGGLWFIRHAVVIFMALLGVAFVDDVMNTHQMLISYAAGLIALTSLALGLTHFKNPTQTFLIGVPAVLVVCAAVSMVGNETLMMAVLMLISIGLFFKSMFDMFNQPRTAKSADYDEDDGYAPHLDTSESLFDHEGDPFLHNHAGLIPYAADDCS